MAEKKSRTTHPVTPVLEFVKEPPAQSRRGRTSFWLTHLEPLRKKPGKWAKVVECETPGKAGALASSIKATLTRQGEAWGVVSRQGEVYACFEPEDA